MKIAIESCSAYDKDGYGRNNYRLRLTMQTSDELAILLLDAAKFDAELEAFVAKLAGYETRIFRPQVSCVYGRTFIGAGVAVKAITREKLAEIGVDTR